MITESVQELMASRMEEMKSKWLKEITAGAPKEASSSDDELPEAREGEEGYKVPTSQAKGIRRAIREGRMVDDRIDRKPAVTREREADEDETARNQRQETGLAAVSPKKTEE